MMIHYPKRLLTRTAEPAEEPVTLEQAKLYLRVDAEDEDELIADLIRAARAQAEEYLRRSLVTQSWKLAYDDYAGPEVFLPRGPVISISAVTAVDREGGETALAAEAYYLDAAQDTLMLDSAIASHRVEIEYGAGYGDADDVPPPIKIGILSHVGAMYDLRAGAQGGIPPQSLSLYAPHREVRV